jgi:hypothetical protein
VPLPGAPALRCTECGRGLTRHQALAGGLCGQPACRRSRCDRERNERFRKLADAERAAAGLTDPGPAWPAVELIPHELRREPVPEAVRQAHVAWLRSLETEVLALADAQREALQPSHEDTSPPWTGALCGACQGRCCRHGAHSHAYLDAAVVARWWRLAQPAWSVSYVLAAYEACIPKEHLADSCVYHGDQGCTLTREMRSDTCNEFACNSLQSTRLKAKRAHTRGVLALSWDGQEVQKAFVIAIQPAEPAD